MLINNCVADISDDTNQAQAYAIIGLSLNVAQIIGPFIGCVLSILPIRSFSYIKDIAELLLIQRIRFLEPLARFHSSARSLTSFLASSPASLSLARSCSVSSSSKRLVNHPTEATRGSLAYIPCFHTDCCIQARTKTKSFVRVSPLRRGTQRFKTQRLGNRTRAHSLFSPAKLLHAQPYQHLRQRRLHSLRIHIHRGRRAFSHSTFALFFTLSQPIDY